MRDCHQSVVQTYRHGCTFHTIQCLQGKGKQGTKPMIWTAISSAPSFRLLALGKIQELFVETLTNLLVSLWSVLCFIRALPRMLKLFSNLSVLLLDNVTDAVVARIWHDCAQLRCLSLTYCGNICPDCLVGKPNSLIVNLHGCWRATQPQHLCSPVAVVEIQLLALQSNSKEGVENFLSFVFERALPELQTNFTYSNRITSFKSLIFNEGFEIQQLSLQGPESMCSLVVTVLLRGGNKNRFLWILSQDHPTTLNPEIQIRNWKVESICSF